MAAVAPLAQLIFPALLAGAAGAGINYGIKKLTAKNPPPPPQIANVSIAAPISEKPISRPVSGDDSAARAFAAGGDTGLVLDPLGRRGTGGAGHATLLGR